MSFEVRSSRVSFFGRFADEITREDVLARFQVSLDGSPRKPQYKEDGYFVFADLTQSPPPYDFEATAALYRGKIFSRALPANTMIELSFPGEDELILLATTIDSGQNRVNFDAIPFLQSIGEGATVLGPGAFSASLAEVLEGNDVGFALLNNVAGLSDGDALRFVRSTRMLLRPGPYYPFPEDSTLLALRAVEDVPSADPVAGVQIQIVAVNAQALNTVLVGGLSLSTVDLPGPQPADPATPVMLGPPEAVTARSNARGDAIFYYPGDSPITSLAVAASMPGYVATTVTIALTPRQRTHLTIPLPRV